jgi:hypothetical protein
MSVEQSDSVKYSLKIVPESLRQTEIENGHESGGIVHTVDLNGRADLRWRKSFYFVQWDCLEYFSFRLSEDGLRISFSLGRDDYPEETQYLVNVLSTLLTEVNRNASVPLFTERRGWGGLRHAVAA